MNTIDYWIATFVGAVGIGLLGLTGVQTVGLALVWASLLGAIFESRN